MNIKIVILLTMQMALPLVGDNTTEILTNLFSLAQKLFTWLANNKMKVNRDKCHLHLSTQESFNIQIASQ